MCIAWEDPALVPPGPQRILYQPAPDAAARRTGGRAQHVGYFSCDLTQAVAAERYVAFGRPFTSQRYDQGTGGGRKHAGAATARSIVEPVTPRGGKASAPALDRRATHPFLHGQPTGTESSGTAQNDTRAACQTLWRCSGPRPGRQALLLHSGQGSERGWSGHTVPPSLPDFYPASTSARKPPCRRLRHPSAIGTLAGVPPTRRRQDLSWLPTVVPDLQILLEVGHATRGMSVTVRGGHLIVGRTDQQGAEQRFRVKKLGDGAYGLSLYRRRKWEPLPYTGTLQDLAVTMNNDLSAWADDWT